MSFVDRARQAAEQARQAASQTISNVTSDESQAQLQQAARGAAGQARRGMVTLVEKIDPGVLAEIVIKATALQERTNTALHEKRSAYRIGELTITATIPPQIAFAITRISDDELEELRASAIESSELVGSADVEEDEIVSLSGTPEDAASTGPAVTDSEDDRAAG